MFFGSLTGNYGVFRHYFAILGYKARSTCILELILVPVTCEMDRYKGFAEFFHGTCIHCAIIMACVLISVLLIAINERIEVV